MVDQKLKLFCLIAEHESFSKAGETIGMSQPGVSRQVRALEDTYGVKLFRRSRGKVQLTEAGESLYKYAREINTHFNAAKNEIGSFLDDPSSEVIRIGSCRIIGNYVLPDYIARFNRKYKEIRMDLFIDGSKKVIDALHEKNIDIGVVGDAVKGSKIVMKRFCTDKMVVIMPSHHKWSTRKNLSILDVVKEPIILRERGCREREVLEKCLLRHSIPLEDLKTVFVTGTTESVKNAVENGLGLSFSSQWAVQRECKSGRLKQSQLKEHGVDHEYSLIYRKSRDYSPSSAKFLEYITDNPVNASC